MKHLLFIALLLGFFSCTKQTIAPSTPVKPIVSTTDSFPTITFVVVTFQGGYTDTAIHYHSEIGLAKCEGLPGNLQHNGYQDLNLNGIKDTTIYYGNWPYQNSPNTQLFVTDIKGQTVFKKFR